MSQPPPDTKILTKVDTEDTAILEAALGPGIFNVTLSEQAPPGLFHVEDHTPVRFFEGVVPIIKPLGGRCEVVGTGFWLHRFGVLATARHVIADLWDSSNSQLGPAFVLDGRNNPDGPPTSYLRPMRHAAVPSDPDAGDVAVALFDHTAKGSEDVLENYFFAYTEDHPEQDEILFSYGYPQNPPIDTPGQTIRGSLVSGPFVQLLKPGEFMYKYPAFRAHIKIDHAASGSPVFDKEGRVCSVASSSITELEDEPRPTPVAHLLPMSSFLDLELKDLVGGDAPRSLREILANR